MTLYHKHSTILRFCADQSRTEGEATRHCMMLGLGRVDSAMFDLEVAGLLQVTGTMERAKLRGITDAGRAALSEWAEVAR